MKRNLKGKGLNLLGFMSALLLGGVITGTPVMADSTNFVVAVQKNPPTMEPMRENSGAQMRILYNVAETLISIDFKGGFKLSPGLATEWKWVDATTLELKLRKGVKFHDGGDMTAEDVAFTFGETRFRSEDAPGWKKAKSYLGVIVGTEIVDDYTIRIMTKTPDPLLEQRLANYMSEIISKKAYLAAADWDEWSRNVVATGPYKLAEIKTGEYIRLERFDDYWGDKAPAQTVTFKVVPEVSARVAGLITGEYDIVSEIPPDQLAGIEDADGINVAGGPIRTIRGINYDETNAVLSDPRVRKALGLAIDRELIVETLYHGKTNVPRGMQQEMFADMYISDWPKPMYDPEKAKSLLKEAGYDGAEISYRVLPDYYTLELATAQILVEMWKAVGLNVKIEVKDNWGQIAENNESRHILNSAYTAVLPDPVGQLWRRFGPTGIFQAQKAFVNEEFNVHGSILETSSDLGERRKAFRRMLEIYHNEDPAGTPLHELVMFYGKRDNVNWTAYTYEYMDLRAGNLSFD